MAIAKAAAWQVTLVCQFPLTPHHCSERSAVSRGTMDIEKILENQRKWQTLPVDDEAAISAAAFEALSKCADAVSVLSENLKDIGYRWVNVERIPSVVLERNIQFIVSKTGLTVPKMLTSFWAIIGGVSFVDLENYWHVNFWQENKIIPKSGFADGLHIDPCNEEWVSFVCDDFNDWQENHGQTDSEGFILSLSPDGYHKDGISGGEAYGVLAEPGWKPIWQNFEWTGVARPVTALVTPPDFLSYLRTTILECAGFPSFLGAPGFDPVKEKLLQRVPLF